MAKARKAVVQSSATPSILEGLKAEIAALDNFELELLRKRWRSQMGRPAPAHLSRALLLRILAYRLQTDALGAIDRGTERALRTIGESGVSGAEPFPSVPASVSRAGVRPGTLLVREYGGVMHRVMAKEEGFTWDGQTFRSLSEVAIAITGTKWSGPRFFDLRPTRSNTECGGAEGQKAAPTKPTSGAARGRENPVSYPNEPGGAS